MTIYDDLAEAPVGFFTKHVTLSRVLVFAYFLGLILSVFAPRFPTAPWAQPHHSWLHWIHNALYLSGPPEVLGNYFLYTPIVYFSSLIFRKLSLGYRVLLGCGASGFVELTQLAIPGRVSSLRDFLTNCTGVVVAGAIEFGVRQHRSRIEHK